MDHKVSKVLSDFLPNFSEAGVGDLKVNVVNETFQVFNNVKVIKTTDSIYTVELTADLAGTYTTNLTYGGFKVPFNKKTTVSPSVDVSKVQVEGLEQSKCSTTF
jgi:filamin